MMPDRHYLHKILLFLNQGRVRVGAHYYLQFLDQILTQTIITTCLVTHPTSTWNCLIRAYSKTHTPIKSILVSNYFIELGSFYPDRYTYPLLLNACSRLSFASMGQLVHTHLIKIGLDCDIYVQNALLHFYGSIKQLNYARLLFDKMYERDITSWNTFMGASYASSNSVIDLMDLFKRLISEGVGADKITLVILFSAFAQAQCDESLEYGTAVHSCAIKMGLVSMLNVSNALLNMYTKYRQMDAASRVFDEMGSKKDVVSHAILINGYVEKGLIDLASDIFYQIFDKDLVLWNVMLHGYIKAKRPIDALELFKKMDNEGLIPDENTMVGILAACASLSDLQYGRVVHMFINRNDIKQDIFVKTALIDMYFKCGSPEEALVTFYKMEYKDVFTWTAVIEGLANNGYGNVALNLFKQMEEQGIQPNEATFVSALTSCRHSGLVKEGCQMFRKMVEVYKLQPRFEHFGCLIDVLSRAGLLAQAYEFVKLLRPEERLAAYKIVLSACIKYLEFDVGEKAALEMAELSPQSCEMHILLSNFYALAGQWERVAKTRRTMKRLNTRKEPGISSGEPKL
ncbi:putative pentatricopeptide repeat-containing protein At3g15930 [Ricinus communis]|uniref:putative pentatricopeptide repeat-containing protein At3g15930 n=1 Tax=Ricinus communis TaxID=3988 RepID=UPI00201ACF38|nr:putative pentatricopeptide repeat-containing protein At3g15930 [Ricinus communis]